MSETRTITPYQARQIVAEAENSLNDLVEKLGVAVAETTGRAVDESTIDVRTLIGLLRGTGRLNSIVTSVSGRRWATATFGDLEGAQAHQEEMRERQAESGRKAERIRIERFVAEHGEGWDPKVVHELRKAIAPEEGAAP